MEGCAAWEGYRVRSDENGGVDVCGIVYPDENWLVGVGGVEDGFFVEWASRFVSNIVFVLSAEKTIGWPVGWQAFGAAVLGWTTHSAHLGRGVLQLVRDDAMLRSMGKTSRTKYGKGHTYDDDVVSNENI